MHAKTRGLKIGDAINQAYDKARQLGEYLDNESQTAIIQFMHDEAEPMLHGLYNKINSFILDASKYIGSFLPEGLKKIHDFFGDLSTFIDQSLSK